MNETACTQEVLDAIKSHEPGSLISIHNHPINLPPAGSDFGAQTAHSYGGGVVALHNGEVYYHEVRDELLTGRYFDMSVAEEMSRGIGEGDAILAVMERLQR